MRNLEVYNFTVPVHHEGGEARVYILTPCSALELHRFMMDEFAFDPGDRNTWEGKCVTHAKVDAKYGCPTAIIALRQWQLNSETVALLAHECFHAAEWMLRQSGHKAPMAVSAEPWEAWEDMAYLLQRIMRRALDELLRMNPTAEK
jgi:hypothetical protein